MADHSPLLIAAALDEEAFAWFEDLRLSHFPRQRQEDTRTWWRRR